METADSIFGTRPMFLKPKTSKYLKLKITTNETSNFYHS